VKRDQFLTPEKMTSVSSAGKHAIGATRKQTWKPCQVRETARKLSRIDVDLAFDWLKQFRLFALIGYSICKSFLSSCTNYRASLTTTKAEFFSRTQDSGIKLILMSTHVLIISLLDFKYAKERSEM